MALFVAGNLSYSAIIYKNRSLLWGITAGIIITGLYILLPDPLYLLNYKTKAAYLSGLPIKPVLVSTCIVLIAYIVPLAVALITQFTRFKNCVPGIIAVSIAGQMIGFGIHQAFAPYMIVYNYGNRGVPETFDCIAGLDNFYIGEGSVMMPVRQCRAVRVDNIKSDLREFKGWPGYIKNAKPQAVVAGPAFCSAGQMKNIFDTPGFGSLMEKDYRRCQFHDCIVYKRISP